MSAPDRAGAAFIRHLVLSYAIASVRGDAAGQHDVMLRLAGRPAARVRAFSVVRAATAEIVSLLPAAGGGVGFSRDDVIADLQAALDALESRCPGLVAGGAW